MRQASAVTIAEGDETKRFSAEEFRRIQRAGSFVGSVAFWRAVERLACPEERTRFHAMGVLRELAERSYEDCGGVAWSPQQAECFKFCGLTPLDIRAPGSPGREDD